MKQPWIAMALAAGFAAFAGVAATAEPYPAKPIRLIVTFPPGGSTDTMARTLQPSLERNLGQRSEHEAPLCVAGMGDHQLGAVDAHVATPGGAHELPQPRREPRGADADDYR